MGSRGIALHFHDHGTRSGRGVSSTPRPLFTPGKDPVPIVQEAGWATGAVWTGAENLAVIGIRSPDRPARSQSMYRLSYPPLKNGHNIVIHRRLFILCSENMLPCHIPKLKPDNSYVRVVITDVLGRKGSVRKKMKQLTVYPIRECTDEVHHI